MTMTVIEDTACGRKCEVCQEKRCYTKTMDWLQTKTKTQVLSNDPRKKQASEMHGM